MIRLPKMICLITMSLTITCKETFIMSKELVTTMLEALEQMVDGLRADSSLPTL